jgi:hypothetical protein
MNIEASLNKTTPAVGCPWAGKEIENPTQTRVWRGLRQGLVIHVTYIGHWPVTFRDTTVHTP